MKKNFKLVDLIPTNERSGDYGYANKELSTPRKVVVQGIGVYTYPVLKKKVQKLALDLSKNAKSGNFSKASQRGIRAFAAMWEALAEYDRNAK
tara:strand:- start:2199 stop:2477 length:279 start_codon:yes stop_codon:yes gene_type:complete